MTNMDKNDAIDGTDVLGAGIRAIKHYIPHRIEVVKNSLNSLKTKSKEEKIFADGYIKALEDLNVFIENIGL